jgi:hypothetical protein
MHQKNGKDYDHYLCVLNLLQSAWTFFYNLYFCKSRFLIPQNKEKAPKIVRARSRHQPLVNRSNRVCSVDMAGIPRAFNCAFNLILIGHSYN